MIRDHELNMVTTVAMDLGSAAPGPGNPIKMVALGVDAALVITTGDTTAAADPLMTVVASAGLTEFELPSDTKRYIKATFAAGEVSVINSGAQTAT
ncbi:MAG: hypothetical protein KAG66_02015 [Methylococcales bacterium]|nr:hypothetical protein [Methylococcales bacterium]